MRIIRETYEISLNTDKYEISYNMDKDMPVSESGIFPCTIGAHES